MPPKVGIYPDVLTNDNDIVQDLPMGINVATYLRQIATPGSGFGTHPFITPQALGYSDNAAVVTGASVVILTAAANTRWILYWLNVWSSIAGSYQLTDGATLIANVNLVANTNFNFQIPFMGICSTALNQNLSLKNNTGSTAAIHISSFGILASF